MRNTLMDFEKLLRVPSIDPEHGYDIAPGGDSVAFSWNISGQWEIYQSGLTGNTTPQRITAGRGGKFSPKYSPDGRYLLYLVDLDGGEELDIYLYEFSTGKHENLTPATSETILPGPAWSPDSRKIAYISDLNGIFDTYLMDVNDGVRRCIFQYGRPNDSLAWSPDGTKLAVCSFNRGQNYSICIVYLDGSPVFELSKAGSTLNARTPCWSPDGLQLAFACEQDGQYSLGIYSLDTMEYRWWAAENAEHSSPDWSPDGVWIAAIISQGPDTWINLYDAEDGAARRFQLAHGVHYAPIFTPDTQKLLFSFDNYAHPTDLWVMDLTTRSAHQLTNSLPPEFQNAAFVEPELVWYPTPDESLVPALLFSPNQPISQPPPAVIVIHGGPSWSFQYLWYPIFQHMTSRGWVVLAPNYRGSTHYGHAWQLANRFDLGGVDTRDVVAGAEYLVRNGLANRNKIALTGRSHGGYLTMTCLTQFPEKFAGGSAIVPFLNWFSAHENIREDLKYWDIENMGDPIDYHERWQNASPYFFLERIQSPVQLVCGGNDPRCPASDSIAARDRLVELGKAVDFLLYPDEGHAFLNIENLVEHELRRVAFLARLLEK